MATDAGRDPPYDPNEEEGESNQDRIKDLIGLFIRAPRRHRRAAIASLVLTLALGFAVASLWPRSYLCDVRILAQRNLVLPALDNPARVVPREADNPTRNVSDTILQRDNIVALITQLDLIDRWQTNRAPILRLKDAIMGASGKKPEDRLRDMIGLLEKRLTVYTDESSITISIEWPDPEVAYEIVSLVQKNFLEARYDANVTLITEAIRILDERAKPEAADVDAALADLTRVEADRRAATHPSSAAAATVRATMRGRSPSAPGGAGSSGASPSGAAPSGSDAAAEELEEVRSRIRLLKETHDRELAQAQSQLADARTTLGPLHPTVVALNEKIAQLSQPSPELQTLSARERGLVALIAGPPAPAPQAPSAPAPAALQPPPPVVSDFPLRGTEAEMRDDPQVVVALSKLQSVTAKYNELLSRMEAANIELEVTRAAFKYEYTVVRPAELPRGPLKPNAMLLLLVTAVLAVLLAMIVPGLLDLRRGRFVESWQVERDLKLPLLGEITPSRDA
jgi:uncharacterized protein involved in exopolysaccharide biosynthesis